MKLLWVFMPPDHKERESQMAWDMHGTELRTQCKKTNRHVDLLMLSAFEDETWLNAHLEMK